MNRELFFESAGDSRSTPQAFFDTLNAEFSFTLDAAAEANNAKCPIYFGQGGIAEDALEQDWGGEGSVVWLNPPYSVAGAFVAKAREEADKGAIVVMLLPSRTDTKWFHHYIWMTTSILSPTGHGWRPGVECRFVSGRLQFELKVSAAMRALVKAERRDIAEDVSAQRVVDRLVEATGLPSMAIRGIWADKPDEDLLSSAPFPSCLVIFRRVE